MKAKHDELLKLYKPLHFLMKANWFLTADELDKIDFLCKEIGRVYPENFRGATFPPKLDNLIFVVQEFSRQ